jgi:predicted enzyme related to lactoylglutathione lyase
MAVYSVGPSPHKVLVTRSSRPTGPRGSLVDAVAPQVTLGVAVANLDSAVAVAEAERLGGSVVMPPNDNGWVVKAQVTDPAGNVLTLIQR